MSNPPDSRTKDYLSSPALSLSLAGIFRVADDATPAAEASATVEMEGGDEGSGGGGCQGQGENTVELSSENSGPSRSGEDLGGGGEGENEDEDDDDGHGSNGNKKRKKYHRHTAEQIREMEALFKESPHPDEKQRQQLSQQLGLAPRQVKFWFQNRRTQIKAIQERHENSLLKSEIDKLREENKAMRQTIKNACCPNCGFATTTSKGSTLRTEEHHLQIENARLKSEVEKLRAVIGRNLSGVPPPSSSRSGEQSQEYKSSLDRYAGIFGLEKSRVMDIVNQAMEELKKMASAGEPLWIRSIETGRHMLNYDEYMKEFSTEFSSSAHSKRSIEASRETAVVFMDLPLLIGTFMDVNQWKEMFPCLISRAATVDIICNGEIGSRNGAMQLMFAELQLLTPIVPTREVYFVRYCKQLSADQWGIVDISIDKVDNTIDASLMKCRKHPSGCIIQDTSNGHCKVIWVEHLECQRFPGHSMYHSIINSGLAFGARHWITTLQHQCERLVFFMATNVPTKESSGVTTLAGRKSILKLAQRMTSSFCHALGASSYHSWSKVSSKTGEDIRVASRKNLNDPGEPLGLILCMVSSVWLPVSSHVLFDYLRDEAHRSEWDIMSKGVLVRSIANLAKGQDRGNAVTIQTTPSKDLLILQDSCTNAYESMVVYAPIEKTGMQPVMTGCDSSNTPLLPSGFSILPDGIESRPSVITSKPKEKSSGGSLLTIGFQVQANPSPTAKLSMESVESANTLITSTLQQIKTNLRCEDG